MDGVAAAGHTVIQSPLLFQGGNLLVVGDPAAQERVLLLAETELYRNTALGLSREQVLDAFQSEFTVDRCRVLPAVSYHLDYDVTVRVHGDRVLAFVNDAAAAAKLILQRGISALETSGIMPAASAQAALNDLARGDSEPVIRSLATVMAPYLNERHQYRVDLVRRFASEPTDAPVFNFHCFLAAMDVLASRELAGTALTAADALTREYFAALRALETTAREQQQHLKDLGWTVIPVPSMPDLYHSLNYLNGLHDRTRYLMPSAGGFYASVDTAAGEVFQRAFGGTIGVVHLGTQEIQRQHGGLHCVAAAYPRLNDRPGGGSVLSQPQVH
jgi:hypothetical protein